VQAARPPAPGSRAPRCFSDEAGSLGLFFVRVALGVFFVGGHVASFGSPQRSLDGVVGIDLGLGAGWGRQLP
jgi:hypothetical protein